MLTTGDLGRPPIPFLEPGTHLCFGLRPGFPFTVGVPLSSFSPPAGVPVEEATGGDAGCFCLRFFACSFAVFIAGRKERALSE